MNTLHHQISSYLHYCRFQKKLDEKTLKAYQTDLLQFSAFSNNEDVPLSKSCLTAYIENLHQKYKPKTAKRKIACIRAFTNYLEFEELIDCNPLNKIRLNFREPSTLPKSLPLKTIKKLLQVAHILLEEEQSCFQYNMRLRDRAVLELLFATGLRVSELCSIQSQDIDLTNGFVKVDGKGSRERIIFISNQATLSALKQYRSAFITQISETGCFFINRLGNKLTEQSVRAMINRYAELAKIPEHITPHMIRHSFATLMLEEDVDIRYIQTMLGHSSISTTQIYTHVSLNKQRNIMRKKHPRNRITL